MNQRTSVTSRRRPHRLLGVLALGGATLLLSGCFDYRADVKVNEDGSGSLTFDVVVDTALAAQMNTGMGAGPGEGMPGGDVSAQTPVSSPEEVCASFFSDMPAESDLPQGVSFALTNEPDRCSLSVTATWVTGETPQEKLAALEALDSEADGASESQPLLLLTEPAEGSWDFRFNPEGLQDTADAGGEVPSETAGFEGFMDLIGRAVFEGKTLRVEVELPGDITEHNGTVDGNRVRWELPLFEVFSGEIEPFHAASKTSPSSSEVTQSPETGTQTQPREEILDSAAPSSEPTAAPSERNGSTLLIGAVLGLLLAAVGGGLWFRRR